MDPPAWAILTLFGERSPNIRSNPADTIIEKIIGHGNAPIFKAIYALVKKRKIAIMIAVIVVFNMNKFSKKSLESYVLLRQFLPGIMGTYFKSLIIIAVCFHTTAWTNDNDLYILHTNNTNGALENCYCPDHPYGAVEKRSVFIKNFILKYPNTIVLDSGDFFSVTEKPILDSLIIEAYATLPYDAVLAGDQELSRENMKNLFHQLNFPVLASNLENFEQYGLSGHIIIERGKFKIAVVGTIHSDVFRYYPEDIREKYSFLDPKETIRSFVDKYSDSADVVVALTHEGHDKDMVLASDVDGIDVIVGSHSQSKLDSGDVKNNCLIVQAGKEGYYVGVVKLTFDEKNNIVFSSARLVTLTLDMPDDPYIMELISVLEKTTTHVNRNKLKYQNK